MSITIEPSRAGSISQNHLRERVARTNPRKAAGLSALFLFLLLSQSNLVFSSTAGSTQKSGSQPGNSSALVREAAALLEAGRLEEAEATARQAVAGQPRNTAARSVLGAILDQRGLA
ncbi:MAG TPA: hypothetical protein VGN90_03390, partial [Pyrinomonadaceae bacterium]|nr:hypothetical protein [Pyrinomonadaceae bacterium]